MASVNKVILVGRLGNDPEVKHLEGDNVVANVSLATSESYKDKTGAKVEQTEWHSLEFWGTQAKIAEQYLQKGSQIYVEGKIKTETWEDKDGNKRYKTKIRVNSLTMLGGKKDDVTHVPPQQSSPAAASSSTNSFQGTQKPQNNPQHDIFTTPEEDDLPF